MSDNVEVWEALSELRRDIRVLKAAVRRLEGQLPELQMEALDHHLFEVRPHELAKCTACGEAHDCALVPTGLIAMGRPVDEQLAVLCESCFASRRWRVRNEVAQP